MTDLAVANLAEAAAKKALEEVISCIDSRQSFVFEAGAGAGKTYSLVKCLQHLLKNSGRELLRRNQQIACMTYTNVAKDEIRARTDNHPVILSETIHSFCWSLLKDFQAKLRAVLPSIGKWAAIIEEKGPIERQTVEYNLGYTRIDEDVISISHEDVISLMVVFMQEQKFRTLLAKRYPIILIDEYQDTNQDFVESLKTFIDDESGQAPLIGFFGDHWQTIYESKTCGKIEHPKLKVIGKKANFRSAKVIVESLNKMRPDLPQEVAESQTEGYVTLFHTNDWVGVRRKPVRGGHWTGDLPADAVDVYLEHVKQRLTESGWDFASENTKTLLLTHAFIAKEQGYQNLALAFKEERSNSNDAFTKKEDAYISFFVDTLEPVCTAYEIRQYGKMFAALGGKTPAIRKHEDKVEIAKKMDALNHLRQTGTIDQVIEYLKATDLPQLSENILRRERRYSDLQQIPEAERRYSDKKFLRLIQSLKAVEYQEVIALAHFLDGKTPYATMHSVKGAEFENVLVVCGRGWNKYNFGEMLEMIGHEVPADKQPFLERNRNLFYVACSRAKVRLAILFTQELSDQAMSTLENWYGKEVIYSLPQL